MLTLHLMALGVWIGCVAVETAFEHRLNGKPEWTPAVADLHVLVDLTVETPAFLAALVSGVLLLRTGVNASQLMIGAGLFAVAFNIFCVGFVLARAKAYRLGEVERARKCDLWQHRLGALVVVFMAAALVGALTRF